MRKNRNCYSEKTYAAAVGELIGAFEFYQLRENIGASQSWEAPTAKSSRRRGKLLCHLCSQLSALL
jgi:hypothetical protein